MKSLIAALLIAILAIGSYMLFFTDKEDPFASSEPRTEPVFAWTYVPIMDGEFPKTRIALTATYSAARNQTKDIDTVDGSCNDYAEPDKDIYHRSTMIICYGAGIGRYFKVVKSAEGYAVMRKTFEEGSPEYDPPEQQFETVASFPLF